MCHHVHDSIHQAWFREEADDDEESETEEIPSFAQEDRDVDVDLLEADDD